MITLKELETMLKLPNAKYDHRYSKKFRSYYVDLGKEENAVFAVFDSKHTPIVLTLKLDREIAKRLVDEYESVMPAKNFSKVDSVDIILSGQVEPELLKGLIVVAYRIASGEKVSS